jgi:hypothetical protein
VVAESAVLDVAVLEAVTAVLPVFVAGWASRTTKPRAPNAVTATALIE